jgi:hypothetical protein
MSDRWEEHKLRMNNLQAEHATLVSMWLRVQVARGGAIVITASTLALLFATYRTLVLASHSSVMFEKAFLFAVPTCMFYIIMLGEFAERTCWHIISTVKQRGQWVEHELGIEYGAFAAAHLEMIPEIMPNETLFTMIMRSAFKVLYALSLLLWLLAQLAIFKIIS